MKALRWIAALFALLFGWLRRRHGDDGDEGGGERIVPAGSPDRRAENWVLVLLGIAILWAIGFVVAYAAFSPSGLPNELLGVCLGACLLFIATALTVVARRLVVTEELEEEYPTEHPKEQTEVAQIVQESGSRFTRKRLLIGAGGVTAGALGVAAVAPALSLGPFWDTGPLDESPWRRGRRLVNVSDVPYRASDVEPARSTPRSPRERTRSPSRRHWWSCGSTPATSTSRRPAGMGAGRDPRLLEDLPARRLRDLAVPLSDVRRDQPRAGVHLPVPLLDVRPGTAAGCHVRPGRPVAAPAAADDRRPGVPARRRPFHEDVGPSLVERSPLATS